MKRPSQLCLLCRKKAVDSLKGISGYWCCPNCDLGWYQQFPKIDYQDDYYQGQSSLIGRLFYPIEAFFYFLRGLYGGFGQKATWIDVGAGDGKFLKTVRADQKIGVEISASGRKIMKESGLKTMTDRTFLRKKGLQAEVISFWHVLEHVEKPRACLEAARKNLKKGGWVIVAIPNLDSWEFRLFGRDWFHFQPQFHLWHFSTKAMKKLLAKTGFKVVVVDHWSVEHHLAGVLQSFMNRTMGSDNALHKLIKRKAGTAAFKSTDILGALFWLTIGLPIVFAFWAGGAIFKKGGTITITAQK